MTPVVNASTTFDNFSDFMLVSLSSARSFGFGRICKGKQTSFLMIHECFFCKTQGDFCVTSYDLCKTQWLLMTGRPFFFVKPKALKELRQPSSPKKEKEVGLAHEENQQGCMLSLNSPCFSRHSLSFHTSSPHKPKNQASVPCILQVKTHLASTWSGFQVSTNGSLA